jgi:hypothetical protein
MNYKELLEKYNQVVSENNQLSLNGIASSLHSSMTLATSSKELPVEYEAKGRSGF